MKIHELKILPEYFEDVAKEIKTFEIRKNDRDFSVGDTLILREFNPRNTPNYSGRKLRRQIVYLFRDAHSKFGLDKDYVILGIKPID